MHNTHTRRRGDGLSFKQILQTLDDVVDQQELTVFAVIGWGLVPFTKSIYGLYANITGRGFQQDEEETSTEKKSKIREAYEYLTPWDDDDLNSSIESNGKNGGPLPPFEDTYMFHAVDHVSQASKIGFVMAIVDSVAHVAKLMGFTFQVSGFRRTNLVNKA